ncbi:MAG: class I adenylate-forming enzyme family protein [Candidatus Binatia bacterium]
MEDLFERVVRHADQLAAKVAIAKWKPGAACVETSYAELGRRAKRLAASLARLTAEQAMVPLLVGKSADSIAAMLGVIATRRTFCFLNTKLRGPQIAAVLDAAASPACVVDVLGLVALKGAWKDHPQIARTTWLVIGEDRLTGIYADAAHALGQVAHVVVLRDEDRAAAPALVRPGGPRPQAAGACLFTSGSTGTPKGVLISEEDLVRRAEAEIEWFGLGKEDVLLSILPFSFDVGLNQLLTALAVGAELVLLESWLPADIVAVTERRRVTGISGVPSIWQDMINAGVRFEKQGKHAALRYITISGGSLPKEYLPRLGRIATGVRIFKTYGQTEAFRSTSLRPEDYLTKLDSVGQPFPGVRVYVVREDGTRCAAGEIGEVVHSGLGTMMGYLGEADSLNPKLRRNPFWGENDPSPLAVFTGDLGYLDDAGYLFLKGRRDGMVKVTGNRVYPQEVADQIATIPGIRDVVVTGMTRADGQSTLIAFLAVARGADLSLGAVRKVLGAKLPAFMVPKEIVIVEQIPRTPSGKPDQRRLVEEYAGGCARGEM